MVHFPVEPAINITDMCAHRVRWARPHAEHCRMATAAHQTIRDIRKAGAACVRFGSELLFFGSVVSSYKTETVILFHAVNPRIQLGMAVKLPEVRLV